MVTARLKPFVSIVVNNSYINKHMKPVKQSKSISKIPKIQKLQAQVNNLQMQIDDYQQIVKELSDKLELLKKFV
jgi:uncharacterized protein YlxW (UPF0749 family)